MRFSLIVPIYNVEKYLSTCIDSILRQTFTDYELILVNDGSTDKSLEICKSYSLLDKRIIIIDKKNGGSSSARNAGLKCAKGEYIIFIDSDDIYLNRFFLEHVSSVLQNNNRSIVFWHYKKDIFENYKFCDENKIDFKVIKDEKELLRFIKLGCLIASAWLFCVPKDYFDEKLLFVEGDKTEDIEWVFNLLHLNKQLIFLNDNSYGYRIRNQSLSNSIDLQTIRSLEKHIDYMISCIENNEDLVMKVFLSEQVANFYIVLSKTNIESSKKDEYKKHLKYAIRLRSKMIKISVKIFGLKNSIKFLRRIK